MLLLRDLLELLKLKSINTWLKYQKNVYTDKSSDIVNKSNNTYHSTIKMKPVDVKDNTYFNFSKESNNKDPKFKVDDCVRISKYKSIFAKSYTHDLTLSWRGPLSNRNQSIDLQSKSMDWFLYGNGLRHERINIFLNCMKTLEKIKSWITFA